PVIDHEGEKRQSWIKQLQDIIRQNLANEAFSIYVLADMVNLSERNLQRRLKAYTGLTPTQFINEVRLQVAYELFQQKPQMQVKQVAYAVGYQKASYFTKLYRERFGVYPGTNSAQGDF
ncbi:helix-turn-helix domain-containing protein, partial [Arsenicibacter rosenii]|uniref:helix-turn-helix domain-containing protein n=1 Tax=Arsenicibacter rosenii TaxID=1750698 RepID=UPI0011601567